MKLIDVDIEKLLGSDEFVCCKKKEKAVKYFKGCKTPKTIRPLFTMFLQLTGFRNKVEKNAIHIFYNQQSKLTGKISFSFEKDQQYHQKKIIDKEPGIINKENHW